MRQGIRELRLEEMKSAGKEDFRRYQVFLERGCRILTDDVDDYVYKADGNNTAVYPLDASTFYFGTDDKLHGFIDAIDKALTDTKERRI